MWKHLRDSTNSNVFSVFEALISSAKSTRLCCWYRINQSTPSVHKNLSRTMPLVRGPLHYVAVMWSLPSRAFINMMPVQDRREIPLLRAIVIVENDQTLLAEPTTRRCKFGWHWSNFPAHVHITDITSTSLLMVLFSRFGASWWVRFLNEVTTFQLAHEVVHFGSGAILTVETATELHYYSCPRVYSPMLSVSNNSILVFYPALRIALQ